MPSAQPSEQPALAITVAQANILDDFKDPWRYGIEYRFHSLTQFDLVPVAGIMSAANGAKFVYGDLRRTFRISNNWSVRGSFGVGRYDPDDIIDLGHLLEFRSGLMIACHLPADFDVELAVYHFSNGGIGHTNPGTEAIVLSVSMPLGN